MITPFFFVTTTGFATFSVLDFDENEWSEKRPALCFAFDELLNEPESSLNDEDFARSAFLTKSRSYLISSDPRYFLAFLIGLSYDKSDELSDSDIDASETVSSGNIPSLPTKPRTISVSNENLSP